MSFDRSVEKGWNRATIGARVEAPPPYPRQTARATSEHFHHGETVVAEIVVQDSDFPWLSGDLKPRPEFEPFRPPFEAEHALLEGEDWEAWERAYQRIGDSGLRLTAPDGMEAAEFLLHVDGNDAWFRWSDKPFDQEKRGLGATRACPPNALLS